MSVCVCVYEYECLPSYFRLNISETKGYSGLYDLYPTGSLQESAQGESKNGDDTDDITWPDVVTS